LERTMKTKLLLPVLLAAITSVTTVSADNDKGFYLGFGYNRAAVKTGDVASSATNGSIAAGYLFNDRMGVDLSTYVIGDTKDRDYTATIGTVALTGVYQMPVSERFDIFGKLGVARTGFKLKKGSNIRFCISLEIPTPVSSIII